MAMPLTCPTRQAALQWPEQTAVYLPKQQYTFRQLDALVSQAARWLQQLAAQLPEHTPRHIGVSSHNSLGLVILQLACLRTGLVFCPLNPRFTTKQLEQQRSAQNLAVLLTEQELTELCQQWQLGYEQQQPAPKSISLDPEQPCDMILTSGSTGRPKAVGHCYRNHYYSARGAAKVMPLQAGDCWLLSLPLYHIGGYAIVCRALLSGSAIAISNTKQPIEQLVLEPDLPVTHLSLVNTQLYRLLQLPAKQLSTRRLKHLLLGGGPLSLQLIQQAQSLGFRTWTTYGMSETASQITCGEYLSGSKSGESQDELNAGQLLPYRQLRVAKDGQLKVKGEVLCLGYYAQGKYQLEVDDNGWFASGDKGYFDPADQSNKLVISGRCDNQFVSGGENIQPETIEYNLCQHPAIAQALVIPVPNAEYGQRPLAFVRWQQEPASEADIKSWLRNRLAGYLCPDFIVDWPATLDSGGLKPSRAAFIAYAVEHFGLE